MAGLAAERLAVSSARQQLEAALRALRTAEVSADFHRTEDGSFPVFDEALDPELFAKLQQLQATLDATIAAADLAEAAHDTAIQTYDEAARQVPLFEPGNSDPILLLPVRLEAVYFDNQGVPELRIRVYPDDVHVDTHEPALTENERDAGIAYWRAVRAAGEDAARRQAAWKALVGACAGNRATWVREALAPLNAPPDEPRFPDVEIRPDAWTRAAQTNLLPHHFEFSAYRDGSLVWRLEGSPIADPLAVGIAPQEEAAPGAVEPDAPAFDGASRWLVDFGLAVEQGMAIVGPLVDPNERFDLLTVLGVDQHDGATSAQRVDRMLAAHAFSSGVTTLPVGTPTNNTPGSRSGWRSRAAPVDPDVAAGWLDAYDPAGPQEAARLARALGVDGATVLARVCDPAGGDEALLQRLHDLQADFYSWSRAFRPATNKEAELTRCTEPWFLAAADHYARFVRARGPFPPIRIGRQPYGLLPVSSVALWKGDDVDGNISRFVGSFLDAFAQRVSRALRIGEEADQDVVLLDLLSREASPAGVVARSDFSIELMSTPPPASTVGAIPATSSLAWLHPEAQDPENPERDLLDRVEAFPDVIPESLQQLVKEHPLTQVLVLLDEALQHMRETLVAPDPAQWERDFRPLAERLDQLQSSPTRSLFYSQADWGAGLLSFLLSQGPQPPEMIARRVASGMVTRDLFAAYVNLEDDVAPDLPRFERLFRETLLPLSHRVDAWVTSLASARLASLRERQPTGIRTGAFGWLTDVEAVDPNPTREGYIVTPSMHHATTAAVLRSGWQAHSDRRAFAVDVQSARVRRALAMIEGVRAGQTVDALLGFQFERALHDARLDRFIAGFRAAYPLAPLVEPEASGSDEARASIGARNVVDGQALRRDRPRLEGDPQALQGAAGAAALNGDAPALLRILGELDETFDAVGDLLLAESVHQLVGGSPLRAGVAADAAGRGQDLPAEYDVLRTPRGGLGATHHVGILFPESLPPGWNDDRPLARLEPGLEAWLRHRLGPASAWALGASLEDLGWCAIDLVVAPEERLRAALAAGGEIDEGAFGALMQVCERLRAALSGSIPLTPTHLDQAEAAPATGFDLAELRDRVAPWLDDVRAATADLRAAESADAAAPVLERLAALGLPTGAGDGDLERVRSLVAGVDLAPPAAPPDPAAQPAEAEVWRTTLLETAARLLHPSVRVAPRLLRALPPAPSPPPADDEVAAWLHDMTLVRPRVDALDGAAVAAEILAGTSAPPYAVAQAGAGPGGPGTWIAVAPPAEGPRPQSALVMQRDGDGGDAPSGLVVDSWTEVVPRSGGEHGPEEVVGVAFDFDRPGARSPQTMLIAVPPDPKRGWCMEDLHACLDEVMLLARVRTLDLEDVPELRTVLPIPNGES